MSWRPAASKDPRLRSKYDQIAEDLARFQGESLPDLDALPVPLHKAIRHIHEHLFDGDLTVGSIRRDCRLRNNNITTHFRHAVGRCMREYVEELRMRAADRLLRDRDLEVHLVAMAVGYDYHETFCRIFRRHFGCSPSQRRSRGFSEALSRAAVKSKRQEE